MRNTIFILLGTLICSFSLVFAQQQEIDSLKKVLPKYVECDTNYINTLNKLAFAYYSISSDSTLILADKAIVLAYQNQYEKGKVNALRNKGIAADIQGDYPLALQLYSEAMSIAKKITNKMGIADLHVDIAIIYQNQGNYPEALENYYKSLKISEELGNKYKIAVNLNNIATIYFAKRKYAEALQNHFESLKIREEIGDKKGISASLNNISLVYEEQGKYPQALDIYFKSIKISEEIGSKEGIAENLNSVANIYTKQGKYAEALENYFKSFMIKEEIGDKQSIPSSKYGIAKVHIAMKNYVKALQYAQEGLEMAKEMGQKALIRDINESLSKIHKAMGKYELALVHHEQFKIYADSLNNLEVEKRTTNLQAQYKFDKETTLMKAEQAKKDIVQEKERNQLYWLTFSAFIGLGSLSVILFLVFRSRIKIQHAYSKLAISNVQVQKAKEEIEAQAEELQKLNHFKDNLFSIIAHDLRSPMAAMQGIISILDPEIIGKSDFLNIKTELTNRFEATDKILQDLLQWTKDQMQGESIDAQHLNLNEIANEKINLFSHSAQHKNISLLNEALPNLQVYADKNHLNIILQNLLSNALKFTYSGGTIILRSQTVGEMVQIMVKDTGRGMSEELQSKLFSEQYFTTKGTSGEIGNGLGLNLVKSLVEKNGGKIWVKSQENKGSEFCFELPLGQNLH